MTIKHGTMLVSLSLAQQVIREYLSNVAVVAINYDSETCAITSSSGGHRSCTVTTATAS
jgi:hypothetical protein